ncbi:MAG: GNAT family N-acetyltransferase [Burkholderiales bacterium]|nr:GNAT family N-acetyltransferase [Burkholderiales bacterium]
MRLRAPDRPRIVEHFTALGGEDRRLRFGTALREEGIRDYVGRIDFVRDGVFAVHDGTMRLLAVIHVAITDGKAELGLSVLPESRNQGVGGALLERAMIFLRNRGAHQAFVHCLSENGAMMHIARKLGMSIVPCGGETDAHIQIDPATPQSYFSEWMQDQNSEVMRYFAAFAKSPA